MHFTYYTERSVSQCISTVRERLKTKSGRLGGWTDKNGTFSLEATCTVMYRFSRVTRLQAKAERENNITVIKGNVSEGMDIQHRAVIYGLMVVIGIILMLRGSLFPGFIVFLAPLPLNIPLEGDFINSRILIAEVQRTLKAREYPPAEPKKPAARKTLSR